MYRGNHLFRTVASVLLALLVVLSSRAVYATAEPSIEAPSGLTLTQIKMTGDEFLVVRNNTMSTIANLSSYWLYYYNNVNPLASGVSNSSQQLPAGSLGSGQSLLLSANGMATCGAAIAGKLNLGLGDSGGFIQLAQTSMQNGAVRQEVLDTVSWSSTASGGISNVPTSTKAPNAVWYRYSTQDSAGGYGWQQAELVATEACVYSVGAGSENVQRIDTEQFAEASSVPPVQIISMDDGSASGVTGAFIPDRDRGLQAPLINELLPNPASPASDDADEFIELYNPNDAIFDLSGFMLQVASTTSASAKTYSFPTGTLLAARGFTAFRSSNTHISMSNSGGQVWLLDPFANVIGQSTPYGTAKDGQVWALANGKWAWTTEATPDKSNIIKVPPTTTKKSTKTTVSTKTAGSTAGASKTTQTAQSPSAHFEEDAATSKIHIYVLAAVAILAVLYGAYEYRHDILNRIHKFRRNRAVRQLAR